MKFVGHFLGFLKGLLGELSLFIDENSRVFGAVSPPG